MPLTVRSNTVDTVILRYCSSWTVCCRAVRRPEYGAAGRGFRARDAVDMVAPALPERASRATVRGVHATVTADILCNV